ncbi:MAG TPA: hypothetical protein IGS52_01210 [Oscillatoriaceae cyanobacterium M33_DOE_052]|uniref:Uncharacterized protein n=1 Tax=Planktothricoides sp. SpSt-374 TaxID=2282167 RepID=A0A7C3VHR5_9CYAN|nr:hypothetical protein [Oscillatoriaceae cyanobacterium M33_DOE_052]
MEISQVFDANYYAGLYPDLGAAGFSTPEQLLNHFAAYGVDEGRSFSPYVDLNYYQEFNPDLTAAGLTTYRDLLSHLTAFGINEKRFFSANVDLNYYSAVNPDLGAAGLTGGEQLFDHLINYGVREGRQIVPPPREIPPGNPLDPQPVTPDDGTSPEPEQPGPPDFPGFPPLPGLPTPQAASFGGGNLLLGGPSNRISMSPDLNIVLAAGVQSAITQLQDFLTDPDFANKITTAFGEGVNIDAATSLIQELANAKSLPTIKMATIDELAGNQGAFDALTNTAYISQEFLRQQANNPENIASVILEEIGHSIDSRINAVDAPGDEGAIFSELVRGNQLSDDEINQLKLENDYLTVKIDGIDMVLEFAHRDILLQMDAKTDDSVMYNSFNQELAKWNTGISLYMNDRDPVPGEIIDFELTIDTKNTRPWWGTRWPYTAFGYTDNYGNKTTEAFPSFISWLGVRNGDWVNPQNWTLEVKDRLGSSAIVFDGGTLSLGASGGNSGGTGNFGGQINFKSNEPNKKPFDLQNYGYHQGWDWLMLRNLLTPNNDQGKFFETSIIKLKGQVKAESVFNTTDWLQIGFVTQPIYSFTGGNLGGNLFTGDNRTPDEYYDLQSITVHVYAPFPEPISKIPVVQF